MPADGADPPQEQAPKARVFFALWPPNAVAFQLAAIANAAAAEFGGKPTRRETIHLTLAFLGDVPESALPRLVELGRSVQARAFDLEIDRLDFWAQNRLLWAGCSAPASGLNMLAGELQSVLAKGGFGAGDASQISRRAFVPHVSLVRKIGGVPEVAKLSGFGHIVWPGGRFVLVRSRLSAVGPDYQQIAEFPLHS